MFEMLCGIKLHCKDYGWDLQISQGFWFVHHHYILTPPENTHSSLSSVGDRQAGEITDLICLSPLSPSLSLCQYLLGILASDTMHSIQGVPKKGDLWKMVTEGHWVEVSY